MFGNRIWTPVFGSLSDYSENELMDHVFNASYSPVATVYVGFSTADPLDDASGMAEPSGNNYAREAITFSAASSRAITHAGTITFNQASGPWGTISHWFICDHPTNTTWGTNVNLLAHGSLNTSKSVVAGNTPSIAGGEIDISFSAGEITDYLAEKLLDLMFRNTAYSSPSTYVGLFTSALADSDTDPSAKECSGGSYARKQVNVNGGAAPTWELSSGGLVNNNDVITFVTPTGSWGTVTAVGIVDAASNGNLLFYDNSPGGDGQAPTTDDTVQFAANTLDVTMS